MHGYWKVTGKDRNISYNSRSVGTKKTLIYYIGRAPSGERTDWVMHEYTLVEEELRRCPHVQDYYVLYKVYKKSGLGPKNGEQYGAPFKEEDWADDDCVNLSGMVNKENTTKGPDVSCFNNNSSGGQAQVPLNNLVEEFLNQIADEPVAVPPLNVNCTNALDHLLVEEEKESTFVNQMSREVNLPVQSVELHNIQQCNLQASVDYPQSTRTQLQRHDVASDSPSAPNMCGLGLGENLSEDFLEIDDLIGSDPNFQHVQNLAEKLTFDGTNVFTEFGFCGDMFPYGVGPGEVGACLNGNLESGMFDMASHSYANNNEDETVNFLLQSFSNDADQMNSELWANDQRFTALPAVDANPAAVGRPISGIVF